MLCRKFAVPRWDKISHCFSKRLCVSTHEFSNLLCTSLSLSNLLYESLNLSQIIRKSLNLLEFICKSTYLSRLVWMNPRKSTCEFGFVWSLPCRICDVMQDLCSEFLFGLCFFLSFWFNFGFYLSFEQCQSLENRIACLITSKTLLGFSQVSLIALNCFFGLCGL